MKPMRAAAVSAESESALTIDAISDYFALGDWWLEHGANPNDDDGLYHSTELGHTRALEALRKQGALHPSHKCSAARAGH